MATPFLAAVPASLLRAGRQAAAPTAATEIPPASPGILARPPSHKRYVSIISGQTVLKIDNAAEINGIATVVINVKTISEYGRYNLREVFGKQNESRDTNFNGTEALSMILKIGNKDSEKYALRTYAVQINTKKDSEVVSVMQVK